MIRITVACPEGMIADANHLAMVLGEGAPDAFTYRDPVWLDAGGNRYALASFLARPEWISGAQAGLMRPGWDQDNQIDMAAAQRAQAVVVLVDGAALDGATLVAPDRLVAVVGLDPLAAAGAIGLSPMSGAE